MSGKSKKTQATTQRPTKITPSNNRSQTDDKEFKRKYTELQSNFELLQSKYEKEHKQNLQLTVDNAQLRQENTLLQTQINDKFLQSLSGSVDGEPESQVEVESDDAIRSSKRRKRPSEEEEKAKTLMRTLLKTYPPEFNLRDEDTFKSKANTEICQKLIPKLQKAMKVYNPSYEQVEAWLQSLHRNKRSTFLKSNQPNQLNQLNPTTIDELDYSSDETTRPAKRQMKTKGKKPVNCSEEEIEEGAKTLLKTLLKTYSSEYNLRNEDTFKSKANTEICQKLVPKLQKDIKPGFNLSYEQVENWLQTWHRNKRNTFLKSNHMVIDDY